jgi:dipeptidase E
MKLLLTSLGLTTDEISKALNELVGKKPTEIKIAFIPTGAHCNLGDKGWLVDNLHKIKQYGYYVEIVELSALKKSAIKKILTESDVIFVGGGNCFYLSYWLEKRGMFDLLPKLMETKVYAGLSAGSMVASANLKLSSQALDRKQSITELEYNNLGPKNQSSSRTFSFVDFVFKPHLNSKEHPELRSVSYVKKVASRAEKPVYAIDDLSAIKIDGDKIAIISDSEWLYVKN